MFCKGKIVDVRFAAGCVEVIVAGEIPGAFVIDNCCLIAEVAGTPSCLFFFRPMGVFSSSHQSRGMWDAHPNGTRAEKVHGPVVESVFHVGHGQRCRAASGNRMSAERKWWLLSIRGWAFQVP